MAEAAVVTESGTEILDVDLKISENPPVRISDRNRHVSSGDKIKWMRLSGAPSFKFVDFKPLDEEFLEVDISEHKIECDFESSKPANSKHFYTIFVEFKGATYTSTETAVVGGPDEGRAVIRN